MFNRMKMVVTFAAGSVAGLTLAACLTVQMCIRDSALTAALKKCQKPRRTANLNDI